ncbi:sulfatase [Archangium sp. Cb G35]|uniref:sulfatase family protein n=1 Tax=Archangium sp. Cb G35 TaxID=1920190 RepID=UPI0009F8EE41|nr:sulfatase [Archangium sp. Cb G35]
MMRARMLVLLVLLAGALGLAFTLRPYAAPPTSPRLIDALANALEVPAPPVEPALLELESFPDTTGHAALAVPIPVEPVRGFVLRVLMAPTDGPRPAITLRSLDAAEAAAFGGQPRPIDGPLPGKELGPCLRSSRAPNGQWMCQRFAHLPSNAGAGLLVISGAANAVRRIEVLNADMPDWRTPGNPILSRLIRRAANASPTGSSWRTGLVARPGGRYTFEVTLPERAELWVGLGHEQGSRGAPVRFIARQDDRVLLDEVVPADLKWHDQRLRLEGEAGQRSRITLEAQAAGGTGEARGLWSTPRVMSASSAPNILLITVDALRADRLGTYGHGRNTSPMIDHIARSGVQFDRATAQSCLTWPSITSLMTGRYPLHTGVQERGQRPPPDLATLPQLLAAHGYDTFAGTDQALFPPIDLSDFDDADRINVFIKPSPQKQLERLAAQFAGHPTFAWFHLENVHYPLTPRQPLRFDPGYEGRFQNAFTQEDHNQFMSPGDVTPREQEHINALYDSAIVDADQEIQAMLATLDQHGVLERTIVVITADHGERLGEHGAVLEHVAPHHSVLQVPLIIAWEGNLAAGQRIPSRVQLIDVFPTLLSLAGVPHPPGLDGRDLSPALRGEPLPEAPAYADCKGYFFAQYRGDELVIINPEGKESVLSYGLRTTVKPRELYDLAKDPSGQRDIAGEESARAEAASTALRAELERWKRRSTTAEQGHIGQAAIEALQQAGYLQGTPDPEVETARPRE